MTNDRAEVQENIDDLISSFDGSSRMTDDYDFTVLTEWFEEEDGRLDNGDARKAVPVGDLYYLSDDALIENEGLEEDAVVTDAMRLEYIASAVEWHTSGESGDVDFPWVDTIELKSSNGRKKIVIGYGFSGYSMEGISTEWYGVFRNVKEFDRFLLEKQIVRDLKELEKIPASEQLKHWLGRKPAKKKRKKASSKA